MVCERVRIYRDGVWEPVLPVYMKNLEENLLREIKGEDTETEAAKRRVVGFTKTNDSMNDSSRKTFGGGGDRKIVMYKNLFRLKDFDAEEHKQMMLAY